MTQTPTLDAESLDGAAFEALPSQAAILDREGTILRTNDAWESFGTDNGLRTGSTVGENYLTICDGSEDADGHEVGSGLRALAEGDRDAFEYEYPCHDPDGDQRWFLMRALPFEGGSHLLVVHQDITDRKLAELAVEERNEELTTLAGVLSHDIRNPLNAAQMRHELLEKTVADLDDPAAADLAENLDAVESSLDRIDAIIEDSLVLAQGGELEDVERVSLATAAENAWSHVATGAATLTVEDLPEIEADEDLLMQLLENLFRNAVEHGSTSPDSQARQDAVEHGGEDVAVTVSALPDGFAVSDTGTGIDPGDRETVFEKGYTTGGTGLGLAIVRKIAQAHGWTVAAVDPATGEGPAGDVGTRIEVTGCAV